MADNDRSSNKVESGSLELDESASSQTSSSSFQCMRRPIQPKNFLNQSEDFATEDMQIAQSVDMALSMGYSGIGIPPCTDGLSSIHVGKVPDGVLDYIPIEEQSCDNGFQNKLLTNEASPLDLTVCDSLEGTVMDLEELVSRVKWLRQILKSGISSNIEGPTWKFVEHPPVAGQK